jgi:hypothetical protein
MLVTALLILKFIESFYKVTQTDDCVYNKRESKGEML